MDVEWHGQKLERGMVVRYLREHGEDDLADAIERGEHDQ